MKTQHSFQTRSLLALLLSLIFIFCGLSVVTFATEPVDTTAGTEVDTQTFLPTIEGEAFESDVIISPPMVSIGGEEEISPMATQILPNGIYSFKNKGNTGLYMDTQYDSTNVGYKLQQYAYSASPTTTVATDNIARGGLFKVSYRADLDSYIIRSMTNNLLSYEFKDGYVVTKQIHADDASVAAADTFKIVRVSGTSVTITPYNQTNCIAAKNTNKSGSAGAPDSYLIPSTTTASGDQALWQPVRYTGSVTRSGYVMGGKPSTYVAGEVYTVNIKTWSTVINANLPYAKLSNATVQYLSGTWNSSTQKIPLSAHDEGNAKLFIYVRDGSNTDIHTNEVTIPVELPFVEGTYYLYNLGTKYLIEANTSNNSSGSIAKTRALVSSNSEKWIFEHVRDGYYKIKSKYNNLYLSVPDGYTQSTGVSVTLETSNNYTRQQWKFENTSYDRYIIRCRASTSYCIKSPTVTTVKQETYSNDNNWNDEWHIALVGSESPIACEIQQESNWCWVASARMFSKNYYPSVILTQEDAVISLKGSAVNVTGTLEDKQDAINYFLTDIIYPPVLDTVAYNSCVYDEPTIRRFLDDGHVLCVSLSYYDDMEDSSSRRGGHAIVLYGYCKIGDSYRYLIHDPWLLLANNSYFISYEKLYCAANPQYDEYGDDSMWQHTLVLNTSYDDNVIPYHFNQEE